MISPESLRENWISAENVPLRERTTVGIGGCAPLLIEPRSPSEAAEAVAFLRARGHPFRILGGGSNLLVADEGFPEAVISTRCLSHLFKDHDRPGSLRVEAGVSLARFISTCRRFGLRGAEGLIGIPGTVGGAAVMNAGGCHGNMGDLIRRATVVGPSGTLEERALDPHEFGYRASPLKGEIVVDLVVSLEEGDEDSVWERMARVLKEKKAAQPLLAKSCGCVFKNPPGESAGRLLEAVGMKGKTRGDGQVSELHANFILNKGICTFQDYFSLICEGRDRVKERFGVDLELEVETWP